MPRTAARLHRRRKHGRVSLVFGMLRINRQECFSFLFLFATNMRSFVMVRKQPIILKDKQPLDGTNTKALLCHLKVRPDIKQASTRQMEKSVSSRLRIHKY